MRAIASHRCGPRQRCLRFAALDPSLPSAVRVFAESLEIVRFRFAAVPAFLMFLRATDLSFELAIGVSLLDRRDRSSARSALLPDFAVALRKVERAIADADGG